MANQITKSNLKVYASPKSLAEGENGVYFMYLHVNALGKSCFVKLNSNLGILVTRYLPGKSVDQVTLLSQSVKFVNGFLYWMDTL